MSKISSPSSRGDGILGTEELPRPLCIMFMFWGSERSFYIGYTNELKRRFSEHQKEDKHYWRVIYYESYLSEKLARQREKKLKYYGSA